MDALLEPLIVVLMGLCFGSFVTLASYRLPRDEDVWLEDSRCPHCRAKLAARDLLPVLSWLVNRRKCRACGVFVHWRYPVVELLTGALFLLIYARMGVGTEGLLLALLAVALLTLIVADFEHYIIPDEIHYVLLPLGAIYRFATGAQWPEILSGLALGLGIGFSLRFGYRMFRHKEGLGLGDVKFLAVAGLWLGMKPLVPFLFFSGVLGVATALLWRALRRGTVFPFGPALAVALFVCVAFPELPDAFWNLQRLMLR